MANSKYEYVKTFEVEDEIFPPNLIVVKIDGRNFRRFSEVHGFEKPNEKRALKLMNLCAKSVLGEYPDIVFSYGFSDEYSFVFKKNTKFYQRRASKVLSIIVSFFSSVYAMKWKEFFPEKDLKSSPSFHGRAIACASIDVLQEYLAWRQQECHITSLYNACFWKLIENGRTQIEAHEILKGTNKQEQNELLHQHKDNYNKLSKKFRQGSCVLNTKVEAIVKYNENGTPVRRLRREAKKVHSKNITSRCFWNKHSNLLAELDSFSKDVGKINSDYMRSFLFESKLMASTWVVIRIDGCHFHRFSNVHEFEKPNDEQALNLMNSCAVAILEEVPDIIFAYGVSDEYSFVLKKDSQFCQRHASDIVSSIVSFFSSTYVMKWKAFFPQNELKYPPSFDGRAVCYPSSKILRDYLTWRQVDCHINNQYNTCFWMLVKSGKSKGAAQRILKGTQAKDKKEMLAQQFGIDDYNALPIMFRQGSSVFRVQEGKVLYENGASGEMPCNKVVVEHCNIIEQSFWEAHPYILQ